MTDTVVLNFNGTDRIWWFNLYAYPELAKLTGVDALRCVVEVYNIARDENITSAMGMVVYCGMVGYDLSQGIRKHEFTYPEVCTWLASATDSEVLECWNIFKKVTGIGDILAKLTADSPEADEKKKKPLRGKTSTKQPLAK